MPLYDISVPVAPGVTPVYPGDPGIEIGAWAEMRKGDAANVSVLHLGAHTGTHVDAPSHFIEGAPGVSELPLDALVGEARVVEIPGDVLAIEAEHVAAAGLEWFERVLFKTRNSAFWAEGKGRFREDFTYITPGGARALVERGVRLVGIDYLSVEKFKSEDFETHRTLLARGVVILEGFDLSGVAAGTYELLCLPLKVASGSGDGAPARALLRSEG
jgi:arylformamidase